MKQPILIATGNPGKFKEISSILSPLPLTLLSTRDFDLAIRVEETGDTYQENAALKALAYMQAAGVPALADDSGLEVAVLDGQPGVHSARLSPKPNANDDDRRKHLLMQLQGKPQPWKAHFHCTVILALPDGECLQTNGRCDGIIIPEERGDGGFGYDPIFYLPEFNATMAELPAEVKNRISHRAKALAAMLPMIKARLTKNES